MQSADSHAEAGSDDIRDAFCRRIMQTALMHRVGRRLDALHIFGFQAQGLWDDISPPKLPGNLVETLRNQDHANRTDAPAGPSVFLRDEKCVTVVDVDEMLLHPNREIRIAALDYLKTGASSSEPWLTPQTSEILDARSEDIESEELNRWRKAALVSIPVIRKDLFLHLAGLRQSFAGRYDDGFNKHLEHLMRPSYDSLAHLRPPLWSPTEQLAEIRSWIAECATRETLAEALTEYLPRCGYIPLASELSAAELARQWLDKHADESPDWSVIWSWAETAGTPLAKYHAVTIGVHLPHLRPRDSMEQFWDAIVGVLDVAEADEEKASAKCVWRLYCELAGHFSRHVEALHPGQYGERVACYGWWLADKVGRLLGPSEQRAKSALERIVKPEAELSLLRWMFARSPVIPSPFRYCSLQMNSVWAMSLLAQMSVARSSLSLDQAPVEVRAMINTVLPGYLLAGPLGNCSSSQAVFAFQENEEVARLCQDVVPPEECDAFNQLIGFRRGISKSADLLPLLERLGEMPGFEQHLTMLSLRDATFSHPEFDDALSSWLEQSQEVLQALQHLDPLVLDHLLESLSEFHQRQHAEWCVRLPHMLAYAIEESDDEVLAERMFLSILLMSVNGGIVSPIERVLASRWRPKMVEFLQKSREKLLAAATYSEPWVAGRVRATSAAISRLIGPRPMQTSIESEDTDS